MSWGFTTQILVFYEIFFCNSAHSSVIFLSKQNGHLHFPQLVIRKKKGGGYHGMYFLNGHLSYSLMSNQTEIVLNLFNRQGRVKSQ